MYREAGARRRNPECPHSVLERGLFVLSWVSQRTRLRTRKCMLENWVSLASDNGETEVTTAAKRCVELLNMLAKI